MAYIEKDYDKFYILIESSNGIDVIFPTNVDDLLKVRSVLARSKNHTNLINIGSKWFEKEKKVNSDGSSETVIVDITEHVLDPLTKIFKFKYFKSLLNGYIEHALSQKESFAVVMADINGLRDINNTYGHQVGDKVLSSIGETLINSFRLKDSSNDIVEKRKGYNDDSSSQKDIFTRIHGDEFAILLPNISLEDSKRKIETIRQNIANLTFDVNGISINLASMSFGIFYVDEEYLKKGNTNPEDISRDILNLADKEMYKDKGKNKGTTYIYGAEPQQTK